MYLDNRITTKTWDPHRVPSQANIKALAEVAYRAPSKQNCYEWRLVILGPGPESTAIKQDLYWNHTWCDSKGVLKGSDPGLRNYNGQFLAPYLFTWVSRWKEIDLEVAEYEKTRTDPYQRIQKLSLEVGICAGSVLTAAEDMGLSTGFANCFLAKEVAGLVGYPGERILVVLGVGYAQDQSHLVDRGPHIEITDAHGKVMGRDLINYPVSRRRRHYARAIKPNKSTLIKIV